MSTKHGCFSWQARPYIATPSDEEEKLPDEALGIELPVVSCLLSMLTIRSPVRVNKVPRKEDARYLRL